MAKPKKYYVVWIGRNPGIYTSWDECKEQVNGYQGAKYKSFSTEQEAKAAFTAGEANSYATKTSKSSNSKNPQVPANIIYDSISVDAACSGNPGDLEYQGVDTKTGEQIFHVGPIENGTNNIGEFLAIVHALALLKKQNSSKTIYSDSATAISWVKRKKANTQLEYSEKTQYIWSLIKRAEKWLEENTYTNKIYKWETKEWGEIKADFGRK
ncbi:ribonuclease H1 domain-containing protein [Bacillus litorisediminis]|uniref:ribonuclease H1 domain-containing protein n=1 Tax=Bacillus litorisediminis TaxID=2922713 RepID=UPI001FACE5A4|nr:ribonuclease H family protein [Bacillus litorisediminis]